MGSTCGECMSLAEIRSRLDAAVAKAGRPSGSVALVAVSKEQPDARVAAVLEQGQRIFGENKVQEAARKWPGFRQTYPGVALHLIGPLQTNKVRDAVALFDVIETLDREKLALALRREMSSCGRELPLLVQVNIGGEAQKAGIAPDQAVAFVARCRSAHGLNVVGLMCIPPDGEPPGLYFAHLAGLARDAGLATLSMGMSGDFEIGIAMGATHVRIGSALFGARGRNRWR